MPEIGCRVVQYFDRGRMEKVLQETAEIHGRRRVNQGGKRPGGETGSPTPRKYVFWDAILYFTGQRYTLTKLQNAGNFKLFRTES